MTTASTLRLLAIAIAIAGLVDPVITRAVPIVQPLNLVVIDSPSLNLPYVMSTRRARGLALAETIRASLADVYAVTTHLWPANIDAAVCPAAVGCVVISDGVAPKRLVSASDVGETAFLAGIRVASRLSPNVAITKVEAPSTTDLFSVAALSVGLRGVDVTGESSTIQVFDDQTLVGSHTQVWPGPSPTEVTARVEWVPLATGLRKLRIVVGGGRNEATTLDNEADVGIEVHDRATNLLVIEPQPTWAATFVRRALERDPRFTVSARTRLGGTVTHRAGDQPSRSIETTRAGVIVVGAPEGLTGNDVEALERFVRHRGGSVVLVPNQSLRGPAARLAPSPVAEYRLPAPTAVGQLRASELLTFEPGIGGSVIASSDRPVVIVHPFGRGRIITSGALDAWRYRGPAYDAFWSSLVADAAAASPPTLDVALSPRLLRPGDQATLVVEWNSMHPIAQADVGATAICGDHVSSIRLWPTGRPGGFEGTLAADRDGDCDVVVTLTKPEVATVSMPFWVGDGVRHPIAEADQLRHAVAAHGGMVLDDGQAEVLIDALRGRTNRQREPVATRPMQSVWWILPFAGCLGAEWWLRRRRGLR